MDRAAVLSDDLLELQRIDTATDQIAHRRATLAERDAAAQAAAELDRTQRNIASMIARQRVLVDTVENAEQAGTELTRKRMRLEGQLKTIISPREAEALMHELDAVAAERDGLDDSELEALEEQSTLVDDLAATHAVEPDLEAAATAAAAILAAIEAELDGEVAALTVQRADAVANLDGGMLNDYERRRARFGGVAVARLDGRRCAGCHLDLSTSELEQARATPPGEVADCPQCGRMLVP